MGRAFKLPGAGDAMGEYVRRISRQGPCSVEGGLPNGDGSARVWVLDRSPGSRILPSEELSQALGRLKNDGARRLDILVGGPDGFSPEALSRLRPALRWSFGPLTLPHELAAVIAAEQIYRAFTILSGAPYHLGH